MSKINKNIDILGMKEMYESGIKTIDIAKKYNITPVYVTRLIKRIGVKILSIDMRGRKHCIDTNYFKKINTEEKAYFLGLLYADGCVMKNRNQIKLSLQEEDGYLVEKFSKALKYEMGVTTTIFKNKKWKKQTTCTINCKEIKNDLINLGCVPKKSLILKFPTKEQVPDHLINHFIRGYFDGDGSIFKNKRDEYGLSIAATEEFCNKLKSIFGNGFIYKHGNIFIFKLNQFFLIKEFCNILYNNSSIYMKRKYDKYLELCEDIKNNKYRVKQKLILPDGRFTIIDVINLNPNITEIGVKKRLYKMIKNKSIKIIDKISMGGWRPKNNVYESIL